MAEIVEIKVGQIWQEVGERRFVRITELDEQYAMIKTVHASHGLWLPVNGRPSMQASRSRFHGKSGGYKMIEDVS